MLPRSNKTLLRSLAGLADVETGADAGESVDGPMGAASEKSLARVAWPVRSALRMAAPYLFGRGEGLEARLPFDIDIR